MKSGGQETCWTLAAGCPGRLVDGAESFANVLDLLLPELPNWSMARWEVERQERENLVVEVLYSPFWHQVSLELPNQGLVWFNGNGIGDVGS